MATLLHAGSDPDRTADAVVATAAADVARHRRVDVGIARLWLLPEQCAGRHDLSRLAVATLHDVDLEPRLLQSLTGWGLTDVLDGWIFAWPMRLTGSWQERCAAPS